MRRTAAAVALVGALVGALAAPPPAEAAADPFFAQQWALAKIGAKPTTAPASQLGAGITVAVVDSGIDLQHPDLAGAVTAGVDCTGSKGAESGCRAGGQDDEGHGTHVAGIIAARAGNGEGVAGVAPKASLLAVRVLTRSCETPPAGAILCSALGSSDDVRAGIHWAVDNGARIINLSVVDDVTVRNVTGSPLAEAIAYAWGKGVIVVAATGNDLDVAKGSGYHDLPLIVVTATTTTDTKPAYANSVGDATWGLAAPGGTGDSKCPTHDILSTYLASRGPGPYACLYGTSMAAPHVSGALAVLLGMGLSAPDAIAAVLGTAKDLGTKGRDDTFGSGRLDLAAAVVKARTLLKAGPAATPPTTAATANRPASPGPATGAPRTTAAPPATLPPTTTTMPPVPVSPPEQAAPAVPPPTTSPDDAASRRQPLWFAAALALALLLGDIALVQQRRRAA